jgi:hypothetical protein
MKYIMCKDYFVANQYIKIGVCLFECDCVITLWALNFAFVVLKKPLMRQCAHFVVSQFLNYQSTTY